MFRLISLMGLIGSAWLSYGRTFEGTISDSLDSTPLEGVEITIVEDNLTTMTNASGYFGITASDAEPKTLRFELAGYMFVELYHVSPSLSLDISMRAMKKSAATLRAESYIQDNCGESVQIPNDPLWDVGFKHSELQGDLAPDPTYTRRDPSAVIQVNGVYYVWYSYSLTEGAGKTAPWDLNDLYYATSVDGLTWDEQGAAVTRGAAGEYDHRSVFTTEIFVHEGMYYLIYQAAADNDGIYNRNVVGMSYADNPDGPWTKLTEPILRPTYSDDLFFDNNAVHDPCLVAYNNQFFLYYKGECAPNWCNPICGLHKQVKWGVAIAESPTGPFVKSEFNPITNTGHEVMVWPYQDGIAILQHQDGPEAETIQFAADGINFEMMGSVHNIPEAAGLYRQVEVSQDDPHAGISWGLGHVLRWDAGPHGWMYINRFDLDEVEPTGINLLHDEFKIQQGDSRKVPVKVLPANATFGQVLWEVEDESIGVIDEHGFITALIPGSTTVTARTYDGLYHDELMLQVVGNELEYPVHQIQAESFIQTGNPDDLAYGGPVGMRKSGGSVNFVNRDDWATYEVSVPLSGTFYTAYHVSTPMENAAISLYLDDQLLDATEVPNNGTWDNYSAVLGNGTFVLESGEHTLKLVATGTNDWQWNIDQFVLYGALEVVDIETLEITPIGPIEVSVDSVFHLSASWTPEEATHTRLQWVSDNEAVAVVDDGEVHTLSEGIATISVMAEKQQVSDMIEIRVSGEEVLADLLSASGLSIFPTRATNYVRITGLDRKSYQIQLSTITGRVIDAQNVRDREQVLWSVRHLPSGLYLIRVSDRLGERVSRVIVD